MYKTIIRTILVVISMILKHSIKHITGEAEARPCFNDVRVTTQHNIIIMYIATLRFYM